MEFPLRLSDLSSPQFYSNPYSFYETLRQKNALIWLDNNIVLAGRYSIVSRLLHDCRAGRDYLGGIARRYNNCAVQEPSFQALSRMFMETNPPEHTRARQLLAKAFDARRVAALRQVVQETASRLVDAFPSDEPIDLVTAYASPLPVEVICSLLNIPISDGYSLATATNRLVEILNAGPVDSIILAKANEATHVLESYFGTLVRERRVNPGEDLISALLAVEENGEILQEAEITSNAILLFLGGHETTTNMIGNALITLFQHPEQLMRLRQRPNLISKALVECMRYDPSVQLVVRTALEDIEIDGIAFPRGTLIFLSLASANRDPARFATPDQFNIERPDADNRMLGFGAGIHHCLGARLGVLEGEIAIATLLSRFPNLRINNLDSLRRHPRSTLRGVESLLATIT